MKHNLNNRFILSSNSNNWILTDKNKGRNNQKSYFPNLKQLSKFVFEIKAKDLEAYFKEITNNERN